MKSKLLSVVLLMGLLQPVARAEQDGLYDVHQHYVPECYRQALLSHADAKGTESDGLPTPDWDVEKHLKWMDAMNIKVAFLSLASPHPYWGDKKETAELVRRINDEGAKIAQNCPGRLKLLATLPLPDVDRSIEEIAHAYDDLKAVGIKLPTNVDGVYLGDEKFAPVFEELNKRKAIVVLHPVQSLNLPDSSIKDLPPAIAMYLMETTYAVLNLIYSSTPERYPDIKFIIPHGGSLLPALADRLEGFQKLAQAKSKEQLDDVRKTLGRFYYDLAGFAVPNQLYGLLNMTDESHLLYGSDYPYAYPNFISSQKDKLDRTDLLNQDKRKAIYRSNAQSLFNLKEK